MYFHFVDYLVNVIIIRLGLFINLTLSNGVVSVCVSVCLVQLTGLVDFQIGPEWSYRVFCDLSHFRQVDYFKCDKIAWKNR